MQKKSFIGNLSWIFVGNLLHAIFAFLVNVLVARVLTVNDNGILNYATSWITFFTVLSSLGINNIINKFTTSDEEVSNTYLCTAMFARIIAGISCSILLVFTVVLVNGIEGQELKVVCIQSLAIVFSFSETLIYWFRFQRQADVVAILRLVAFFVSTVVKIYAIIVLKNIYLYTFGVALETILFGLFLIFVYKKKYKKIISLEHSKFIELMKTSYPFIFSSLLTVIYSQTDRIMLRNMLNNDAVAYYSVAVTLASMMSIVTSAVIEGFRPEIISKKNSNNIKDYELRLRQVYSIVFWLCIVYGLFISFFSKYIILIIYGKKYLPAQPALALIVWYTSFSYFGAINNIYMLAEKKEKYVQFITLLGSIVNVILNILFIPHIGIVGAAFASLLTQFFANFILLFIIKPLRPVTKFIFEGICFKNTNFSRFTKKIKED